MTCRIRILHLCDYPYGACFRTVFHLQRSLFELMLNVRGQVLLASVSGGFVFLGVPPTDWRVSYELKGMLRTYVWSLYIHV